MLVLVGMLDVLDECMLKARPCDLKGVAELQTCLPKVASFSNLAAMLHVS